MSIDVVEVESKAVPQEAICDFFDLVLHLNGEKDSLYLMKPTIIKRYNYQELTLDGQKWTPSLTHLPHRSFVAQSHTDVEDPRKTSHEH